MIQEIIFEHTISTWVIFWAMVAALLVTGFSFWRYLPMIGGNFFLLVLRVLFLLGLCWCMLRPVERRHDNEHFKPRFLVVTDTSASMDLPPQNGNPKRWEVVQEILKQPWTSVLAGKAEIDAYGFDTEVTAKLPLAKISDLPVKGTATRLRDSLQQILDRYKGQSLAGVLLLSDGLDTREVGNEWTAGPWPVPIYTVQMEAPAALEENPDVRILKVDTPRRVVEGWKSELTVAMSATGTKGATINVQLYENDKLIQEIPTQIASEGGSKEVKFQLDHNAVGNFVYTVKIPPLPKETILENNQYLISVSVTDAKNRVLFVDGAPRFEFKFLKRALERNKVISPVILFQGSDGKLASVGNSGDGFRSLTHDQLAQFKIAILGNVSSSSLGDERAKALVKFVSEGGSLVLLGGDDGWSKKGFVDSPLKELLPFTMAGGLAREQKFVVSLTQDGETHPALRSLVAKWTKPMHVLSIFPVESVSPAASVVMKADTHPLVVTQRFGQGKVVAVLSGTLWRWQLEPGQKDEYLAFWDGLLQWLLPQASDVSEYSLDLTADVEQMYLGDTINLTARYGGTRAAQNAPASVTLEILLPDGRSQPFPMQPLPDNRTTANSGSGYSVAYKAESGGMFKAVAHVTVAGKKLDSSPFSFYVKPFTPETNPLPQNFDALKALSQASGGRYCDKDEINTVLTNLEVKMTKEDRLTYKNLYDSPILLVFLMGLLALDWIIRKTRNMA